MSKLTFKKKYLASFLPILLLILIFVIWEIFVKITETPHYILPTPTFIFATLIDDWSMLFPSMVNTLEIAFVGFILAGLGGISIALLLSYSKTLQNTLLPLAVILQVTPIIAISPLIIIYVESTYIALLICVWLVAFFPVLTNTMFGLNAINRELIDLFKLYNATKYKTLLYLRIPSSIPSIVTGLKIAAGLSLIGAIVAEFAAGSGGSNSGLAFRILEAGYRLNISRMFACLFLLAIIGIIFHKSLEIISQFILKKWDKS
ncbi:MAG: ABC transporter permease [Hyphomicrobiales bacterium]|jgi:NitT/TauT family transport system permease protein|nr:ABC transporter permease [Hyphomicrobiales bacterium]